MSWKALTGNTSIDRHSGVNGWIFAGNVHTARRSGMNRTIFDGGVRGNRHTVMSIRAFVGDVHIPGSSGLDASSSAMVARNCDTGGKLLLPWLLLARRVLGGEEAIGAAEEVAHIG